MTHFDRRQLRYFVAVAEELHFSNAARRLHISQPPLSQQIAALEADLGAQLFVRTKRKVEITAAGQQFLQDARAILHDMQKAGERARRAANGETGVLRIGMNYTAPFNPLLATILRRFAKLYPHVGLELHENTSAKQLDGLYRRTLDACFIWPTRDDVSSEIIIQTVSHDPLALVMSHDHPLARKRQIKIEDLRETPVFLTLRQTRTPFYDAFLSACLKVGFEPDLHTHIIQLPFILNAAITGRNVAFLPAFLARVKPKEVLFRSCPFLPKALCQIPLSLASHRRNTPPVVRNFIAAVTDIVS